MVGLTAIIRCKPGMAEPVLDALVAVGVFARAKEPKTVGYRVVRSSDDPLVFITQEWFTDRAAMEAHNAGEGSRGFFAATEGLLEAVDVHVGEEAFTL